jgi:hypothetical protein
MAPLAEQLYSQSHWVDLDGVQTVWNFSFSGGYILPSHVKAYYLDADGERVEVVVTEGMLTGEFQLTVSPAVPATATRFVIYRDTPKDLPLVDFEGGAQVTERNLDRAAKQAVFCAAEVLDGASVSGVSLDAVIERIETLENVGLPDTSTFGFKALRRNSYTGSSNVLSADNGRAHYKTDGTSVTVPAGLPDELMTTVINWSDDPMTVTFAENTYLQLATPVLVAAAVVAPRGTLSLVKVGAAWLASGTAEEA